VINGEACSIEMRAMTYICDMTHSYAKGEGDPGHVSIDICDMTHMCAMTHSYAAGEEDLG